MAALPPYPAIGTAHIQIFGPPQPTGTEAKWDTAKWDAPADTWESVLGWQEVTAEVLNAQISWGADDPLGVLSVPAAGSWSIQTYDPKRLLDPANYNSPFQAALQPGGLMRIVHRGSTENVVRVGFLDEIEFDLMQKTGAIRGSDAITLMVKARLPGGLGTDPSAGVSLRARARWALEKAQITYITVEDDPSTGDPAVGPPLNEQTSAWQQILTAAYDCLSATWLDENGVLRFRSFGDPRDTGVDVGDGGIPIDTLGVKSSLEGKYNHVITLDNQVPPQVVERLNQRGIDVYGDLSLTRDRETPFAGDWCQHILDDRSAGQVQYGIGTLRPQTEGQLVGLLNLGMVDVVHLRVSAKHGTPVNRDVRVLGGRLEMNVESGWSGGLVTYEPEWHWVTNPAQQQIRIDPDPERDGFIQTLGSAYNYGDFQFQLTQVASSELTDVKYYRSRALQQFEPIDWSGVARLVAARWRWYRWPHTEGETMELEEETTFRSWRITEAWDKTTIWPGPAVADENVHSAVDDRQGQFFELDVTSHVLKWAPTVIGGGGLPQYGLSLGTQYDGMSGNTERHAWLANTRVDDLQGQPGPQWYPYLLLYVEKGTDQVVNGSFEQVDANEWPDGWSAFPNTDGMTAPEDARATDGSRVMQLVGSAGTKVCYQALDLVAGAQYKLYAKGQRIAGAGSTSCDCKVSSRDDGSILAKLVFNQSTMVSGEASFIAPPSGGVQVDMSIAANVLGTFILDEVRIEGP